MKRKLVIAMIIIGGGLATLQAVMLGVYLHSQDKLAVDTQEQANRSAEESNAALQAQFDRAVANREKGVVETAFETPALQKTFDAGKLDQAALDAKKSPIVKITWIMGNSWIITTVIITLFTFLALIVPAAVLWFRDDTLPITWAEGLTYAGGLFWFMIVINGMIPDLIIKIWDNVFKIKGTFTVPLTGLVGPVGWQWDWFVVRDLLVVGWYVVTLVGTFVAWYWAQELMKRSGETGGSARQLTSPYGRPVLSASK